MAPDASSCAAASASVARLDLVPVRGRAVAEPAAGLKPGRPPAVSTRPRPPTVRRPRPPTACRSAMRLGRRRADSEAAPAVAGVPPEADELSPGTPKTPA